MRRQGPPMNSGSLVSSITSTLPWAGATMAPASGETRGSGSRKNQKQNSANRIQSPNRKRAMPVRKVPTMVDAMPMPTTQRRAMSVQKINFSAAWVALPLCFMAAILFGAGGVKRAYCPCRSAGQAGGLFSYRGGGGAGAAQAIGKFEGKVAHDHHAEVRFVFHQIVERSTLN